MLCRRRANLLVLLPLLLASAAVAYSTLLLLRSLLQWCWPGEDALLQLPQQDVGNTKQLPAVCAHVACARAFLRDYSQRQRERRPIPAIRHILWKSTKISKYFMQQLSSWQRIHSNWTYVLWRDEDLAPFVEKFFPGRVWSKFKSMPVDGVRGIMRIDMFRYLLMYKFGGVYADLDYSLVSSLDWYRRFPAVVTREPEAHALQVYGVGSWPIPILGNPAFFMSAPGHRFFQFSVERLIERCDSDYLRFAGPFGLSSLLKDFVDLHNVLLHSDEFVYVPQSYSFYPYARNRLSSSHSRARPLRLRELKWKCVGVAFRRVAPQLRHFCADIDNLDPITDNRQPVVAVHDLKKAQPVYLDEKGVEYTAELQELRLWRNVQTGAAFMQAAVSQ